MKIILHFTIYLFNHNIDLYLKNASKEDISEVGINDLQLPGGVVRVVVQELVDNSGQAGGRHFQ